ncbi:MAG: NYN domain-containing protein [Candidatus Taylorbacteria bacterium]|nr:NYN domain-containing protein [Candidatus Taylorbacteria bacterium]
MSVIKHKEQRVGVFLDAQNLYHSAKNLHHGRVNFENVLTDALSGRQLVRAIAYVITTETGEESGFFDALNKMGIETKTKDLQIFSSGSKKADWDVGLAIDAVKLASKLDVVVLASGDGDFIPLVEYLKMQGCQVEVITFGKSASGKLKEVADDFIDLDSDPRRYVLGAYGGGRRDQPERRKPQGQNPQEQNRGGDDGRVGGMRKVIRKLR